jgi:hypothetical protein
MFRPLRSIFVGAAALMIALLASSARAETATASPMDGRWRLSMRPDAATTAKNVDAFDEEMLIENGQATCSSLAAYGFTPCSASIVSLSPVVIFNVSFNSDSHGMMTCTATLVSSTKITGTVSWQRPNGTDVWKYTFEMNKITASSSGSDSSGG